MGPDDKIAMFTMIVYIALRQLTMYTTRIRIAYQECQATQAENRPDRRSMIELLNPCVCRFTRGYARGLRGVARAPERARWWFGSALFGAGALG